MTRRASMEATRKRQVMGLLRNGWSVRQIAKKLGVSLAYIQNIAGETSPVSLPCSAYRCPGCGHRVKFNPCLICLALGVARNTN